MPNLIEHSRQVILRYQQASGAYPACPTMPDYQFSWFRDGSFISHAMLLYGEPGSASAFHQWAANTILRYEVGVRRAMTDVQAGRSPNPHDVLRARYTYDGGKGPDDWPEFQLDGLGTWVWALREYCQRGNQLTVEVKCAVELVTAYLSALWMHPCHDLWEEDGDRIHTYTLAAIFGGLTAAADLLDSQAPADTAEMIREFILSRCVTPQGTFIKSLGVDLVDGSLLGLAAPYKLLAPDDPLIEATVKRIESDLYVPGRGVHRYVGDSYYGGGAWVLLDAWLGWYYAERGDTDRAKAILTEIERLALPNGDLPEQVVPPMLADVSYSDHWVKVRGAIATPLLWSHAMYLILSTTAGL